MVRESGGCESHVREKKIFQEKRKKRKYDCYDEEIDIIAVNRSNERMDKKK